MATEYFRTSTDLPNLIDLLNNSKLTLLDPLVWEDKNDSYFLLKYKEAKKLKTSALPQKRRPFTIGKCLLDIQEEFA